MNNREISNILSETARLMELHGINAFKIKSIQNAAFNISKLDVALNTLSISEIEQLKGIGKSISIKIQEIISSGTLNELEVFLNDTPHGVVEMMHIKGIGPKKVAVLWKSLGVETPGELLYACNENRLTELKGFGLKTQEQIKKAIEYFQSNKGLFHFAAVEKSAQNILELLVNIPGVKQVSFTGELRRKCEILDAMEFILETTDHQNVISSIHAIPAFAIYEKQFVENSFYFSCENLPNCSIHLATPENFAIQLLLTTGSKKHIEELALDKLNLVSNSQLFNSEEKIYKSCGLHFIEPELREGLGEIELARNAALPQLIEFENLKGCLHNHSTHSDGSNTIREMAEECIKNGYQYFGICDHSKSAFYANGLSEERVQQQHIEIDLLNKDLVPFKIFKGIESDILPDGSLDYNDEVLEKFDFVVASVHSVLKMTEQKATDRLIKAISNPFTTILGHPTGRLLLARNGYPIDHQAVIDACAKFNVVLELNANPYRLDIDWRWIRYAVEKGVMISINPDAHHISGIHDMYYGICVARKGMLTAAHTFNAKSVQEVHQWFTHRKSSSSFKNEIPFNK